MTLTEAAYWARRFGVIIIAVLAVLILTVYIMLSFNKKSTTEAYVKPDYACTDTRDEFLEYELQIPTLELLSGSTKSFEIDTETGRLDSFPGVINVYKYDNPGQSIDSQSEAKVIAESLGFNPDSMVRQGVTEYEFKNNSTFQTLVVQARNLNFSMTTDFTKTNAYPLLSELPKDDEAKSYARTILQSASLLTSDYGEGTPLTTYINIEPDGTFSEAGSRDEAELIRVDFYRTKSMISIYSNWTDAETMKDEWDTRLNSILGFEYKESNAQVDGKSVDVYNYLAHVVMLDTQKSLISVYIGPSRDGSSNSPQKSVYGIDYTNWYLEPNSCGTYELISPNAALEIIKDGGGSLIYLNEKGGDTVVTYKPRKVLNFVVNQVLLGYYDSPDEQEYLQPIYIIYGEASFDTGIKGEFYYYVPAINYDAVTDKVEIEEPIEEENSGALF